MKPLFNRQWVIAMILIITSLITASAQPADATRDIDATLRRYFTAMAERDTDGLRSVLHKQFILIEAKPDSARPHLVDTRGADKLLPPEGNQDWRTNNMKIASVAIEVSNTHPSVAMASIVVSRPLDDKTVASMEDALKQLDGAKRATMAKQIAARATDRTMLAMLARQAGAWKIVCLSVPKK
jgi:hypothetical protein